MNKWEKYLVIVVRIEAAVMLLALVAVVMPYQWMNAIHQLLTLGPMPDTPITGYLSRSLSAFYAMVGAILLFATFDLPRYLPLIRFMAMIGIMCGLGLIVLDISVHLPWFWILFEGPIVMLISGAIFWLAGKVRQESDADANESRKP